MRLPVLALALLATASTCSAQADNPLGKFLADVTPGAVSAGSLVGVSQSAITNIQTSQDLVLAIKPFTSGDSKAGFGLAITPARTSFAAMSGRTYTEHREMELLGNLTASYAQNNADIQNVTYRKSAYSLDTFYYFDLEKDPIQIGEKAFVRCAAQFDAATEELKQKLLAKRITDETFATEMAKLVANEDKITRTCIDADLKKAPWNSAKVSLSYGQGWIRPDAGSGSSQSLGKSWTLNGQLPLGRDGAALGAVRRTRGAVDPSTLGSGLVFTSSTLASLRLTYGSQSERPVKALVEVSNAKSAGAALNSAFKYAVGVDWKIFDGGWLEFRVGRSRTIDNKGEQSAALLKLTVAPSSTLFGK